MVLLRTQAWPQETWARPLTLRPNYRGSGDGRRDSPAQASRSPVEISQVHFFSPTLRSLNPNDKRQFDNLTRPASDNLYITPNNIPRWQFHLLFKSSVEFPYLGFSFLMKSEAIGSLSVDHSNLGFLICW